MYGHTLPTPVTRLSHTIPTADSFTTEFATIYADVQAAISHAQQMFTRQANKHHKAYAFSPGDYVILRIEKHRI